MLMIDKDRTPYLQAFVCKAGYGSDPFLLESAYASTLEKIMVTSGCSQDAARQHPDFQKVLDASYDEEEELFYDATVQSSFLDELNGEIDILSSLGNMPNRLIQSC